MKLQSLSIVRSSLLGSAAMLALFGAERASAQTPPQSQASAPQASFAQAAIPARVTQAIDETQLVRFHGNVHPLARPEFDQGIVSDATPMKRMMLVLQRSPEQQAALSKLMDEQLSKDSPNFHKWLTPEQFGRQFGPADADIQTLTDWLTRQGFQQINVGVGRTAIEFSGNVGQVRNALHTEIHQFKVNGEVRQANVSDPRIPAALAPVVTGVLTLHNFPRKSMRHVAGIFTRTTDGQIVPQFTTSGGHYVVGPADFAKIYNVPSSLDGTGQSIAIVADSNINPQDAIDFRNLFGLPSNPPIIILNGPDPGTNGDEGEADLDVQVSGMVAPKATIDIVVSEDTQSALGIDLSAFYIIDNNIAPVMSESFGFCEAGLGAAGNAFYNRLWEQAAAQGISAFVSAGDGASAGCDNFNTATSASNGLAVSGFASTPFNVAVGGTDFDDFTTQTLFWNPSTMNALGTRESALGYIHEIPWNNSCAATATSATLNTVCVNPNPSSLLNIVGGSGGPSSVYAKPAWQSGIIPSGIAAGDNHRYVPDVSLFASNGPQSLSFYLTCQADGISPGSAPSCVPDASGHFSFFGSGGTSASSPAFAGIMALINQNNGRQGNPNPVLYKIAATAANNCNSSTTPLTGSTTCAFYDVTKGNNSVPCGASSKNCSSTTAGTTGVLVSPASATTPAWSTTAGSGAIPSYDLATGLGSVNVANLATQWPAAVGAFHATTTSLTVNGSTTPVPIAHGTAATVKVSVSSTSTGTITGDVGLLAPNPPVNVNGGIGDAPLSGGSANLTGVILPGGTYNLNARYAGDTTFASSTSTPGVPVMVSPENSRLQYGIVTFNPANGAILSTNATSLVYGSPYILRMDILNSTSNACQPLVTGGVTTGCAFDATGTVTFTDSATGTPPGTGAGAFTINSAGHAENQPIQLNGGVHNLSATYSGDISYNAVTTPVTDTVTVSTAATSTALASSVTTVAAGTNLTLTATISSASNSSVGTTGTVTFFNGATPIGSPVAVVQAPASTTVGAGGTATLTTSFSTLGIQTITATYNGDTNYALSSASAIMVTVTSPGSFTLAGAAATVTAGGSGNSAITLTPTGGFTGSVAISCGTTLPGVTCNALNVTVPAGGANGTGSLVINVAPPSTSTTAMNLSAPQTYFAANLPGPSNAKTGWWTLSGAAGFAAILLVLLPSKRRYRIAVSLGLVCLFSFTIGCSNNYGGGGGGGPVATTTTLTVSSTKQAANGSLTVSATVAATGRTPGGTVTFFADGTALGTAVPLTNGSTGQITVTAAQAPAFLQLVGTHKVTASYSGDAYTSASASGTLNITITGTTQLPISGSPAASNANATVALTIQ